MRSNQRTAQAENNVTIETVKHIAVNLQARIAQFGNMMEKLGAIENKEAQKYTCILWLPPQTWGQKTHFKSQTASS